MTYPFKATKPLVTTTLAQYEGTWVAFHKAHGRPPQPTELVPPPSIESRQQPTRSNPHAMSVAPMSRGTMHVKSGFLPAPVDLSDPEDAVGRVAQALTDADAVRIVNGTIAQAAEDGTLPELQAALASHFGLTDPKDIARLWRNLGAELGLTERTLARREEQRRLEATPVLASYGSRVVISSPKKANKSKRPKAFWER